MRRVVAVLVGIALVASGCSGGATKTATLRIDADDALADQPVRIEIGGLHDGESVTLNADTVDGRGIKWHADAMYKADANGVVDPGRVAPVGGSYQGVDAMGLFWSMIPAEGDPDEQYYAPPAKSGRLVETIAFTVTEDGRTLATGTATRHWMRDDTTYKSYSVGKDKVTGVLYRPRPDGRKHPAVIVLGGSEGGIGGTPRAALLAAHGYTAFSVGYFFLPGLPQAIDRIPLEYFRTAAQILASQPGVDPAHLLVTGVSRGAEAALLVAQNFPDIVHGAVLWAPSSTVIPGYPTYSAAAWTLGGKEIPTDSLIPVDKVSGPVLMVAGGADLLSESVNSSQRIVSELDQARNRYPHKVLTYPDAGHLVGTPPFTSEGTQYLAPVTNSVVATGGTRAANAAARRDSWPQVLALLASVT